MENGHFFHSVLLVGIVIASCSTAPQNAMQKDTESCTDRESLALSLLQTKVQADVIAMKQHDAAKKLSPLTPYMSVRGLRAPIPCRIHQTWKTNNEKLLPAEVFESVQSFRQMNPDCEHKLWSDAEADAMIKDHYPEVLTAYNNLDQPVQRADLFRYAIVHRYGGFYVDADVKCLRPVRSWAPTNVSLLVGYENTKFLNEEERIANGFARGDQFEQFMFGAVAGHPVMKRCLEIFLLKNKWGIKGVLELTGPGTFSDAVHEFLLHFDSAAGRQTLIEEIAGHEGNRSGVPTDHWFPGGMGPPGSDAWILTANHVGGEHNHPESEMLIYHTHMGSWSGSFRSTSFIASGANQSLNGSVNQSLNGGVIQSLNGSANQSLNGSANVGSNLGWKRA